jgi:predicted nucleic acid-binding protein
MVIVDTSVWIDYLVGHDTAQVWLLDDLLSRGEAATGDLVVCEVLQGIKQNREFENTRRALQAVPVIAMVDETLAIQAAENYRLLRRRGVTIRGTIDCLIATATIAGGHQLLHSDRDFDPFEQHLGLQVAR